MLSNSFYKKIKTPKQSQGGYHQQQELYVNLLHLPEQYLIRLSQIYVLVHHS